MKIAKIKEVSTSRYSVELFEVEKPNLSTYYIVRTKRIGRNARWYNSQIYEWTELSALSRFTRKVNKLHLETYGRKL